MIILWSLLLTAAASAHKVVDSVEDIGPEAFANVTTLYPVANQQTNKLTHNDSNNENLNNDENTYKNENIKSAENSNKSETGNKDGNSNRDESIDKDNDAKEDKSKAEVTSWKIETAYAASSEKDNITVQDEPKNETQEFKPSQHIGNIEEVKPTKESYDFFTPVIKSPASVFVSSKEEYPNKIPKELLRSHHPYKFESSIITRAKDSWRPDRHKPFGTPGLEGLKPGKGWPPNQGFGTLERPIKSWSQENNGEKPQWDENFDSFGHRDPGFGDANAWGQDSLEPRPTVEAPVKLPAGGLYKYTDPFKEKPGNHDEDFGLEFNNDVKDYAVKKRANPWEGVLRMLTAFIPVGIIISALTPSIITIENTGPGNTYPSNIFRRIGAASTPETLSEVPAISERCRRRLLCELHNEKNYSQALVKGVRTSSNPRKWKQCHRIRCEDPAALTQTLKWLLDRQENQYKDDVRLYYD